MAAAAIIPLINLGIVLAPEIPVIAADIRALFAKHGITDPAQQAAIVQVIAQATIATNADTTNLVDQDQASHPPALPGN